MVLLTNFAICTIGEKLYRFNAFFKPHYIRVVYAMKLVWLPWHSSWVGATS